MSDILAHPPTLIATLQLQFGYTHGALKRNLEGVDADAALRVPEGGGNTINWIVGHVLASRKRILDLFGSDLPDGEPLDDELSAIYGRGSSVPGADTALSLDRLRELHELSQERLLAGLAAVTADTLAKPAPFSPRRAEDETIGSLLAGLAFHEAYHVGQVGLVRRQLGLGGALG